MALTTVANWRATPGVTDGMILHLTLEPIPDNLENLLQDNTWCQVLHVFLTSEFSAENLEFLKAVDDYKRSYPSGNAAAAREIYELYVRDNADKMVNVSSSQRRPVSELFDPPATPPDRADIFDACYVEILRMTKADKWTKFVNTIGAVKKDANPYAEDLPGESERPAAVYEDLENVPPPPDITAGEADKWNEAALKGLREGESTDFWEVGGSPYVIVIKAQLDRPPTPKYLTWANTYTNANGKITMTAKGSVFAKVNDNRGKVTVSGAADIGGVTAAIGRFSQKEVVKG